LTENSVNYPTFHSAECNAVRRGEMEESDAETANQLFHVLRFSENYGMLG